MSALPKHSHATRDLPTGLTPLADHPPSIAQKFIDETCLAIHPSHYATLVKVISEGQEALRTRIKELEAQNQWQPIENVPDEVKSSAKYVWLYDPTKDIVVLGYWAGHNDYCWTEAYVHPSEANTYEPTYYLDYALPAPPVAANDNATTEKVAI